LISFMDGSDINFKDIYNTNAEPYLTHQTHRYSAYIICPHVYREIGNAKDKSIMDIACGSGYHLDRLKTHNPKELIGLDLSEEQIKLAKSQDREGKIKYYLEDMFKSEFYLGFGENRFDIVYSVWGISNVQNLVQMKLWFQNIFSVLINGGKFILYTHSGETYENSGCAKIEESKDEVIDGGDWEDGTKCKVTFFNPQFEISYYAWSYAIIEKILKEVGFVECVADTDYDDIEGRKAYTEEEWNIFKINKPLYMIVCRKS